VTSTLGSDADREGSRPAEDGSSHDGPQPHTIRLELADEPGELLAALEPISENGGNLLSIFHERGNVTPRGRIPVEVDIEATPDRFEAIVAALRDAGVNVVQAGAERYAEELVVLLVGDIVGADLSDTLRRVEGCPSASVADVSVNAPAGRGESSSARLRLATRAGGSVEALSTVRELAAEKDLHVVEPLAGGGV
jgi:ACT domain-containing protein